MTSHGIVSGSAAAKGNTDEILRRLKLHVKAGGTTKPGLVNRRKAEAEMFVA
jgi:GH24 family phage-related lysozyme (muramidase)